MAYVCIFNAQRKKVVGETVESVTADIKKKFPDLQNLNFNVMYYDKDVNDFLDFDDMAPPPKGANLRLACDVLASETVREIDSDETQFSVPAIPETASCSR